jgi:hypothetical protein
LILLKSLRHTSYQQVWRNWVCFRVDVWGETRVIHSFIHSFIHPSIHSFIHCTWRKLIQMFDNVQHFSTVRGVPYNVRIRNFGLIERAVRIGCRLCVLLKHTLK